MDSKILKDWTLLIYANGNNELSPEIWQSINNIDANNICASNTNVIIQVSRETKEVVEILRPRDNLTFDKNYWCGTRRYLLNDNSLELLDTLGNLNMAHPQNIADFIVWATKNYPAKRYALSIGGHIYQLTGILPDYSQETPYIAGFPEISLAIESACKESSINLDILILDTCFGNSVEVIYEFGKSENTPIQYMLTYIGTGPIKGLPYDEIIKFLDNCSSKKTAEILRNLVDFLNNLNNFFNLIIIKFDYNLISKIKILFSNLAYSYLQNSSILELHLEPFELLSTYDKSLPWMKYLLYIDIAYTDLILYYKSSDPDSSNIIPLYILNKYIPNVERQIIYYRLSFCKSNFWFNLLSCIDINDPIPFSNEDINFKPVPISRNILYSFICTVNDNLDTYEKETITENLIKQKGWCIQ